jgi:ubiquinone/menaquinone biosynthesis C-methylase UbiE
MTGHKDFQHPRFARTYPRIARRADRIGGAIHRRRTLTGLTGKIIEVGAGHGPNFTHYPDEVSCVVAVEPDNTLRDLATYAAARAPRPVTVVAGHADALPAQEAEFDAAVASLVLCAVPRPERALTEIRRVLRPGGVLHFYEHVRSDSYGRIQDVVTPIWSWVGGGCHPNRDTVKAIESAGFRIEELDRFPFRPMAFLPASTHVIGRARRR